MSFHDEEKKQYEDERKKQTIYEKTDAFLNDISFERFQTPETQGINLITSIFLMPFWSSDFYNYIWINVAGNFQDKVVKRTNIFMRIMARKVERGKTKEDALFETEKLFNVIVPRWINVSSLVRENWSLGRRYDGSALTERDYNLWKYTRLLIK